MTLAEVLFEAHGLPAPETEYRFAAPRRWRFDYAWPAHWTALEVEGGVWSQGRHTRGKGFVGDVEKYNLATVLGWRVLRCTPSQLESGKICETLKRVVGNANETPEHSDVVTIRLRPLKSSTPVPVRLRRALKCLLRSFGFRCVKVESVAANETSRDGKSGNRSRRESSEAS